MAFVVETGTGLTNSNAYTSVAAFKSYHDDRGNSYAGFTDSNIEKAIVRASDYLDTRFTFLGYRRNVSQSMEWPRYEAFYQDGRPANAVPVEIAEACAEYALRALSAPLAPDPVADASGRMVSAESKQVGPISISKQFSRDGSATSFKPYPAVDARLRELIVSGNRVLRA
jgi:hypothetical protein